MTYTTLVIHAEVFQDNNSAYLLAMNHCLSECSKSINIRCHFFWEYVHEGHVKISKCSTSEQQADYLTNGVGFEKFENNTKSNQGW